MASRGKGARGRRRGHKIRHQSLIEDAQPIFRALMKAGLLPHPGLIDNSANSQQSRVILKPMQGGIEIAIIHAGAQRLWVYGKCDLSQITSVITGCGITNIVVREGASA